MSDDIDLTQQEPTDDGADDALLAELSAAAAVHDAVPPAVLAAAKASLTWRTIDTELADLAFDSSVDESRVLVRGPQSDEQLLTFETEELAVDLQVTKRGDGRRLVGQLAPAGVAEIEVRTASGVVVTITSDELGRVPAVDVPAGSLSLRIRRAGAAVAVVTDWVTV
ncbi:MAG: hypothetical protein QOI76_315 [Frankiales bacterium]|nr:hypothetical protein [Frankiales bacterium]